MWRFLCELIRPEFAAKTRNILAITITVKSLVRPIVSLDKKKSAKDGADLMVKSNVGSVVVSDGGNLVGIVTERDMLKKVLAAGKDPAKVSLGEIMSSPLLTIETSKGLGDATSMMLQHKIRRLIAVENGKMVGIFTQRDLQQKVYEVFRSLAENQTLK